MQFAKKILFHFFINFSSFSKIPLVKKCNYYNLWLLSIKSDLLSDLVDHNDLESKLDVNSMCALICAHKRCCVRIWFDRVCTMEWARYRFQVISGYYSVLIPWQRSFRKFRLHFKLSFCEICLETFYFDICISDMDWVRLLNR